MKNPSQSLPLALAGLAFALCGAPKASAIVLLTDNFTVDSNHNDPNYQIDDGRQGGSLATPTVSYVTRFAIGNNGAQVGNSTTFSGNSNALLLAFGDGAYPNYDFSTVPSPITITFDGVISSGVSGDASNWISMQILGNTGQTDFVTTTDFGILFRANGGTQYFDHGGAGVTGGSSTDPTNGLNNFNSYKIVLSDTAGTGSAFGSGGSVVSYYENGTLLGTANIAQLSGSGYIGFGATSVGGIDNLVIQSVPEAGSTALVAAAGGLLLARRKRR